MASNNCDKLSCLNHFILLKLLHLSKSPRPVSACLSPAKDVISYFRWFFVVVWSALCSEARLGVYYKIQCHEYLLRWRRRQDGLPFPNVTQICHAVPESTLVKGKQKPTWTNRLGVNIAFSLSINSLVYLFLWSEYIRWELWIFSPWISSIKIKYKKTLYWNKTLLF